MERFNTIYEQCLSEGDFSWDPMTNLAPKAEKIHELLRSIGDDEMTEEHAHKAAQMIAGSESDWSAEDYPKLIQCLAYVVQKFSIQSMN